jgi:Mrp family chromosome partitioning ATPase
MSRVYSALTGSPRPAGAAVLDAPDDGVWENSEAPAPPPTDDTPFIEIGGPSGPVFSSSLALTAALKTIAPTESAPRTSPTVDEPTRVFPRLAPTPAAYLSVRFHEVSRPGAKEGQTGPDGSLVAFHLPEHSVSGEYRTLRDAIRKQLPETPSRSIVFTAAASEAGTTTVLLNLAVTLATESKGRVLVVDANVKRAAVAAKLGLKSGPGVCEVLANRVPLTLAIQPSVIERLDVLSAGDSTDTTPVSIGRELARLTAQLRHWYEWVVVDSGVWGTMPERDATCTSADAVYLVTRAANVERPEFTAVQGWVRELGGLLRGYVTTRV